MMYMNKKGVAILGSTGSIGTQALEVVFEHQNLFDVRVLTANNNYSLLIEQAKTFKPNSVVITNEIHYETVNNTLSPLGIKVYAGKSSLCDVVSEESVDVVLTALVGFSGLQPTISAIKAKKTIALANKETLVVAGGLISQLCEENSVSLLPVDSEHSAIFQCLVGESPNSIEKLYLTASGGPFRGFSRSQLENVSKKSALKHPNWKMGAKITIDSASLMNKGLELIEARWLFDVAVENIEVVVHPQSIIHSGVQFEDGSIIAQIGIPDMKLPIQYALAYPGRIKNNFKRFNFFDYPNFSFEKPDEKVFRNLFLAKKAIYKGGNMPCVLNAANEIAVDAFLKEKIGFLNMSDLIENCMEKITFVKNPTLEDYLYCDSETRKLAKKLI
ncbi:MAG: 1-deoxy-D-xylulose-5-phosphate reductoisomerase [Flavobacteriales bacterium]|nr:1-deoxy-D-xylulose-5-phosphate reductoisomerase [Flavobacteriales bacterium]